MTDFNLLTAWVAIFLGLISGTILGAFFHNEDWVGGYGSWRRRMLRLGHISFFGIGLLNLAYTLSTTHLQLNHSLQMASILYIVGAVTMPAVCFLSAWSEGFRRLFFVPVLSLIVATGQFILTGWLI